VSKVRKNGHTEQVLAFVSAVSLLLGTLHGTVTQGPLTPVCLVGQPCEGPAPHLTLRFTRNGVTNITVTNRDGRYRIRLRAGYYAVRTNRRPFGTIPRPGRVHVVSGRDLRVDFFVDTGIR